ncbi:MAG: carboxypeptidase-like regulatory domain-containing protein, partial [Candidatus Berkelbacteria bacterium]|nr:carboxypeptidase-like regulatory domain-containing protein [Candidatus Berkelbacteria bacterium]
MLKKRLFVFLAGVILVTLLIVVGVFIRGPHTFVLDMTPSGSPSNSPSPSQPMGTTGGPWPSGSQSPTPPPTTSGPPSSSPTPSMSMSPSPTPGGGPYTIISEGDLDIEVSGAHGIIHVKWHTTSPMTGVETVYFGMKGGSLGFPFQIDLSQGSGEYDISGPISGGPPDGPVWRLQTGYCYVDFYFDKYSVEVDFPISPGCYEVVPPPQGKAGIFGFVYDANDPDHPRIDGASVTLEAAGGYPVYPGTILTNPDGEYQYTDVNPGTFYKLVVMKEGYETKEIPDITLQAGVEKNQNAGLMPQAPPKVKFTFAANIYNTQDQNFATDVK